MLEIRYIGEIKMKKVIIAAAAALFACAVQANEKAPAKPMTAEECKTAMAQCEKEKDVAACKEKLRTENGCQ